MPVQEGGQELVNVRDRIFAFRLQAAQRFLYDENVVWEKTAEVILRRVGGFGLDKHLFLMKLEQVSLSELTSFYKSMLQVWKTVLRTERDVDNTGLWVSEEPLFFNPLIQTRLLSFTSVQRCLLKSGAVKLGHLINEDGWKSVEQLKVTGLRSSRLVKIERGNSRSPTKCLPNIHCTEI